MRPRGRPRAFSLIEMVVGMGVLAIGLATIAFIMDRIYRNTAVDRQWIAANHALDAAMESLVIEGYDKLDVAENESVPFPGLLRQTVPGLVIVKTVEQTQPNLKTITLRAMWHSEPNPRLREATLRTQVAARQGKGGKG